MSVIIAKKLPNIQISKKHLDQLSFYEEEFLINSLNLNETFNQRNPTKNSDLVNF